MRRNIHFIVPAANLRLDMKETLPDATILYEWGSKVAKRYFCKTCGILPFYTPRSNPDGVGITLGCVDFGSNPPQVEIKQFDGQHWEDSYAATSIASQSK